MSDKVGKKKTVLQPTLVNNFKANETNLYI